MKKLFVAMPIDETKPELEKVLSAIEEIADKYSFKALRIDKEETNEKITDRIIDHIKTADYIAADLTHLRPNVFYEAGFAHGQGKDVTFIAEEGTELSFDIKDYPVIFFNNITQLKERFSKRIKGVIQEKSKRKNSVDTPTEKKTTPIYTWRKPLELF